MADLTKQFEGLPLGTLICQPIIEVARGQAALCGVYLDYILKLAYKDGKGDDPTARVIEFQLERMVTNGNGDFEKQSFTVQAPLLSLVPVPAFTMEEASVNFSMEVKESTVDVEKNSKEAGMEAGFSWWGFSTKVSGKVSTSRENTRTSDKSAKYEIHARAIQQPPAEGMAKLTSIFASVIEPMSVV